MQHRGAVTIERLWGRARRLYRHVQARLRRSSTVLLLLLVLGLGEPLLCIIHCDVWLPLFQTLHVQHTTASVHNHYHHHGAASAQGQAHSAQPEARAALPEACAMRPDGSVPTPLTPPSPIHDLLLTALVLLGALLLCALQAPSPPLRPRQRSEPPPAPPPIPAF